MVSTSSTDGAARRTGRLDGRGGLTTWIRGLDKLDRRGGSTDGAARPTGRLDHLDPWSRQARPTGGATEERGRGSAAKPREGRDRLDPVVSTSLTYGAARPPGPVVSTSSTDGAARPTDQARPTAR